MAKVRVTHKNLTGEDATVAPKRTPVPPGLYHAMIMQVNEGATKHKSGPLSKISVQFQILYKLDEETGESDETEKGRRVYQDYILEDDDSMPDINEQRRYELRMLLDATGIDFDDEGFDTDDMKEKIVAITVRHREGDKTDDEGNKMVFTNVIKVDSTETEAEAGLV